MARASDRVSPTARGIDRRTFLGGVALGLMAPGRVFAEERVTTSPRIIAAAAEVLEKSPYVYVSPLKRDGAESTCHGEVWFAWIDGTFVVNSRRGTWKVKALEQGLDRARVWVGDHGRWKSALGLGRNEAFRQAPSFETKARFETDRAVLDRLIAIFDKKYAGEFAQWREDMQTGFYSGKRKLIRYEPLG
jgi:hypothetical protein